MGNLCDGNTGKQNQKKEKQDVNPKTQLKDLVDIEAKSIKQLEEQQENVVYLKGKNVNRLKLQFQNQNIGENEIGRLLNCFEKIPNILICDIDLSDNILYDGGATMFFKCLEKYQEHLYFLKLDLTRNKLNSGAMESLKTSLEVLKNLTDLIILLEENEIQDQGLQFLVEAIGQLKNLTYLEINVQKNKIQDHGFVTLLNSLANNTNLKTLVINVNENEITNNGIQSFETQISKLIDLNHFELYLRNNQLGDSASKFITNGVFKAQKLVNLTLSIDGNQISEYEERMLATNIKQYPNLKYKIKTNTEEISNIQQNQYEQYKLK